MLGVGTGEALNEVAVGSVAEGEWPEFKERFARLREAVRLMRELWTQDRVTFEGDYYRTEDAAIYDRPDQPVPVYVAAGGPMVARYAGRVGDGFICTSGKGRELYADQLIPAVDEGLGQGRARPRRVDRMIEIKLSWDPDPEPALENTRFWAPLSLTAEQKHSIHGPAEMEQAADELPIEQVAKRWIVASTPRGGRRGGAGLHRPRLRPPRRPRPRPRPGAVPAHLRRAGRAGPARADSRAPGERTVSADGIPDAAVPPVRARRPGRPAAARAHLRRGRPAVMAIINRTNDSFWSRATGTATSTRPGAPSTRPSRPVPTSSTSVGCGPARRARW